MKLIDRGTTYHAIAILSSSSRPYRLVREPGVADRLIERYRDFTHEMFARSSS